ncbi:unnamed protein product [Kluyveromyces dobzhanskii CBS 2104]|uniref:Peroxin-3 n=1 Tax=Kluyveromyces dobzhanskii CBS 2104 TaxID=1427455 RepID=A0A0A8L9I2_9SACH|nr:unnamed protein product [Kluyveromyces dobzhanskii CBS 2104]
MVGNRSLVQRHRRKFAISSVLLATLVATCAITVYFSKRWLYKQHLKMSEQRFVKEQIKRRFVQTQQDSLYTLYELMPVMTLVLAKDFDLESIVEALKGKKLQKKLSRGDADGNELENEGLSSGMSAMTPAPSASAKSPQLAETPSLAEKTTKSKAELWNDLKLKAIAKVIILSYTTSLLMLLTRLQLNILARREYLDTAINSAMEKEKEKNANQYSVISWVSSWITEKTKNLPKEKSDSRNSDGTIDHDTRSIASTVSPEKSRYVNEQAFLSLSWWLLNRGYLQYKSIIEQLVKEEFQELNPRDNMSMDEFSTKVSKIFVTTNKQFFQQSQSSEMFISCLLPEPNLERFVLQQTLEQDALKVLYEDNLLLKQLVQETNKCLQSPGTWIVLESLIDETFHLIMEQIETNVNSKTKPAQTEDTSEATVAPQKSYQIALFSIATKDCSNELLKAGLVSMNNKFLQKLHSISALDDLSACVYSNFGL